MPQRRNNVMVHKKKMPYECQSYLGPTHPVPEHQRRNHSNFHTMAFPAKEQGEKREKWSFQRAKAFQLSPHVAEEKAVNAGGRGGTPKEEKEEQEHESVLWRRISLAPLCPRLGGGAPPAGHGLLIEDGSVGCPHSLTQREGEKALLRSLGFGPRRGAARMAVTSLLSPLGVGARPLLRHQVAGAWASPRDAVPMGSRSLLLITN